MYPVVNPIPGLVSSLASVLNPNHDVIQAVHDVIRVARDVRIPISDVIHAVRDVRISVSDVIHAVRDVRIPISDVIRAVRDVRIPVSDVIRAVRDVRISIPDVINGSELLVNGVWGIALTIFVCLATVVDGNPLRQRFRPARYYLLLLKKERFYQRMRDSNGGRKPLQVQILGIPARFCCFRN